MYKNKMNLPDKGVIGAFLILSVLVFSQFFMLDLFKINGFIVSVHKFGAACLYPLALYLIGWKSFPFNKHILFLAVLQFLTFSFYYIYFKEFNGNFTSSIMNISVNVVVALFFLLALQLDSKMYLYFGYIWVFFSVCTAIICCFQFIGILGIPKGGFVGKVGSFHRSSGYLFDPNFQAAALLAGIGFIFTLKRIYLRSVFFLIVALGIVTTLSRMGYLLLFFLIVISPILIPIEEGRKNVRWNIWGVTLIALVLIFLLPPDIKEILFKRIKGFFVMFTNTLKKSSGPTLSEDARVVMFFEALKGFISNPFTGIGLYNSPNYIKETLGYYSVIHNTFLEILLAGGVWGVLFLVYYFFEASRTLFYFAKSEILREIHIVLSIQAFIYFFVANFLSYHLDVSLWILFVALLNYRYFVRNEQNLNG